MQVRALTRMSKVTVMIWKKTNGLRRSSRSGSPQTYKTPKIDGQPNNNFDASCASFYFRQVWCASEMHSRRAWICECECGNLNSARLFCVNRWVMVILFFWWCVSSASGVKVRKSWNFTEPQKKTDWYKINKALHGNGKSCASTRWK